MVSIPSTLPNERSTCVFNFFSNSENLPYSWVRIYPIKEQMIRRIISDKKLISYLKNGGKQRDTALIHIYSWEAKAISMVVNMGGNEADGEDVFQDGLLQLLSCIDRDSFRGDSSLKTFLMSICRNLFLKKLIAS